MTALFDLDDTSTSGAVGPAGDAARAQQVLDQARADHGFALALEHAQALGGRAGLGRLDDYRGQIAAVEALILAEHVHDDGNTRRAERMLADGKTSKREQRKRANRAKAVGKNNDLASKLASGALGEEQLDVIADASAKTDGDAAVDPELIDKVAAVPPEQGKSIVDKYLAERATADGVQTEHDRQRALRRASTYHNKAKGLDSIGLDGDGVSRKAMWNAIEKRADEIYKRDGGHDLPNRKHPRTREQRLYDAAQELLTGKTITPTGRTKPDSTASSKRHTPRTSARPRIVVALTVDKLLGRDPAAVATQHGLGLIPDSVLADYAADADIFTALFDRSGVPLWLGRLERYATPHQMVALILRDRGCVLCGADPNKCQAHHSMPFNAPGKGRTDLDQLVLLCSPCHTQLHAEQRTIYQNPHGTWQTRPATPHETPPTRPNTTRNTVQRE